MKSFAEVTVPINYYKNNNEVFQLGSKTCRDSLVNCIDKKQWSSTYAYVEVRNIGNLYKISTYLITDLEQIKERGNFPKILMDKFKYAHQRWINRGCPIEVFPNVYVHINERGNMIGQGFTGICLVSIEDKIEDIVDSAKKISDSYDSDINISVRNAENWDLIAKVAKKHI